MRRLSRVSLIVAAVLAVGLPLGCKGGARDLTPINAEQESLNTTKPFAASYLKEFPAEKQEVDDFYATWQGRIDKEKAAAPAP